jgi:hypothetical protein
MPDYCTEDPKGYAECDYEPPDNYSGNRHTTATLTGLLDLAQREKAENQTQNRPDEAMAIPFVPTPGGGG